MDTYTLIGYTSSDLVGFKMDRKSSSWYRTFIVGNSMSWRTKKYNVVSLSSVRAEYRTLYYGITEFSQLKILLSQLGFGFKKSMTLFCDNIVAIEIAINIVQYDQTMHIELNRTISKTIWILVSLKFYTPSVLIN